MRNWFAPGYGGMRAAHVEGDGVYRGQHRGGADHLGRPVDVVRGAEHGPDAVQAARLGALAQQRPASGPGPHHHLRRDGRAGLNGCDCRCTMHQLPPHRVRQGSGRQRRRSDLHHQRPVRARPPLLDGKQHHLGLLQPTGPPVQEEGNRRRALHRLGGHGTASDRGRAPLLLVSLKREYWIYGQILADQEGYIKRGIRQEKLRVAYRLYSQGMNRVRVNCAL